MMSRPKAARELIAFYLDAGVDALLGEEPVNRMADDVAAAPEDKTARRISRESPLPIAGSQAAPPRPASAAAPVSPDAAVMAAREAAKNATTLDELRALLADFE